MATGCPPSPKAPSHRPPDERAPQCWRPPGHSGRSRRTLAHVLALLVEEATELTDHRQRTSRFLAGTGASSRWCCPTLGPGIGHAAGLRWLPGLATTSSGFAATLGRLDGSVTRQEAIAHPARLVQATDLPVTADLETGFADAPAGVAETVGLAAEAGLAGCSVEDFTGHTDDPIYDPSLAAAQGAGTSLASTGKASWSRRGSRTCRCSSPTRLATACTRPSSRPPSQAAPWQASQPRLTASSRS
jgi:Phosphoenolpyruvate phosphomutase